MVEGGLEAPFLPSVLLYYNVGGRKERSGGGRPEKELQTIQLEVNG